MSPPSNNHSTSSDYEMLILALLNQEINGLSGIEVVEMRRNVSMTGLSPSCPQQPLVDDATLCSRKLVYELRKRGTLARIHATKLHDNIVLHRFIGRRTTNLARSAGFHHWIALTSDHPVKVQRASARVAHESLMLGDAYEVRQRLTLTDGIHGARVCIPQSSPKVRWSQAQMFLSGRYEAPCDVRNRLVRTLLTWHA